MIAKLNGDTLMTPSDLFCFTQQWRPIKISMVIVVHVVYTLYNKYTPSTYTA